MVGAARVIQYNNQSEATRPIQREKRLYVFLAPLVLSGIPLLGLTQVLQTP